MFPNYNSLKVFAKNIYLRIIKFVEADVTFKNSLFYVNSIKILKRCPKVAFCRVIGTQTMTQDTLTTFVCDVVGMMIGRSHEVRQTQNDLLL